MFQKEASDPLAFELVQGVEMTKLFQKGLKTLGRSDEGVQIFADVVDPLLIEEKGYLGTEFGDVTAENDLSPRSGDGGKALTFGTTHDGLLIGVMILLYRYYPCFNDSLVGSTWRLVGPFINMGYDNKNF